MKQKKQNEVKITSPKLGISPSQLTTYLVDLDKVKLFEAEVNNFPWFVTLFFTFLALFIEKLINLEISDSITRMFLIVTIIFAVFTCRSFIRKSEAWNNLQEEKLDLYEGLKNKEDE